MSKPESIPESKPPQGDLGFGGMSRMTAVPVQDQSLDEDASRVSYMGAVGCAVAAIGLIILVVSLGVIGFVGTTWNDATTASDAQQEAEQEVLFRLAELNPAYINVMGEYLELEGSGYRRRDITPEQLAQITNARSEEVKEAIRANPETWPRLELMRKAIFERGEVPIKILVVFGEKFQVNRVLPYNSPSGNGLTIVVEHPNFIP
ncbi:Hypothetical protein PBC10988_5890 [Planctomycetales bacterium 10988]|nr:Hypothetical protein PBC10988_5890 [Planctomycetales bacterium 10988]